MATERRLIDANALLKSEIDRCGRIPTIGTGYMNETGFKQILDLTTTVDAVEVVHGRWVDEFGGKYANPKYICSHCTLKALDKQKRDVLGNWQTVQALTDYCPNCGAKMAGDENV